MSSSAMMRSLTILTLGHLLLSQSCRSHLLDARSKPFMVEHDGSGSVQVQSQFVNETAICTFNFRTRPTPRIPSSAKPATEVDAGERSDVPVAKSKQDTIAKLGSSCANVEIGYWNFEVCLFKSATQKHGSEEYSLGTFMGYNDKGEQIYEKGTLCDGVAGTPSRSTVVEFVCDRVSTQMHIVKVQENQMHLCQYKMIVSSPRVCGNPNFREKDSSENGGANAIESRETGEEDWILQMSQLSDGRLSCSVFSTQTQHQDQLLNFHQFSLQMKHYLTTDNPKFRARSFQRKPILHRELRIERGSISEGGEFNGHLSFIKIFSEPFEVSSSS